MTARNFHVIAKDGSIDKRATRERRLFGPDAEPVKATRQRRLPKSNWNGQPTLRDDGSIDKRATRERRIFGEPEDRFAL